MTVKYEFTTLAELAAFFLERSNESTRQSINERLPRRERDRYIGAASAYLNTAQIIRCIVIKECQQ